MANVNKEGVLFGTPSLLFLVWGILGRKCNAWELLLFRSSQYLHFVGEGSFSIVKVWLYAEFKFSSLANLGIFAVKLINV